MKNIILMSFVLFIYTLNSQEFTKVYKSNLKCIINNNLNTNDDVNIQLLAFNVFKFDNVTINIVPYDTDIIYHGYNIKAFTIKNSIMSYTIYIDKDVSDVVKILCHEFIHIKQFLEGRLIIDGDKVIFDGKDISNIKYMQMPHEKEAYRMYGDMLKSLNALE